MSDYYSFRHCVAGMHIGTMAFACPSLDEVDSVLTVAAEPGVVADGVRHRHLPISYMNPDRDAINTAIDWVLAQVRSDRRVLVRSEGGMNRPALIVAGAVLHLGGTLTDATMSVRHARPIALSDFRYERLLRDIQADLHGVPRG